MNEQLALSALQRVKVISEPRNFKQTVELIINFRGIDFKKPANRINLDIAVPFSTGKQQVAQLAVFVKDKGLAEELKAKGATVIMEPQIQKISKKEVDKLLAEHAGFLAEGATMLTVAKYLGQILAPKGKMPKPIVKASAYDSFASKAASSVKVSNNKGKYMPVVQVAVGKETQADEEIVKNAMAVYNSVVESLSSKEQGIKSAYLKLTMGKPVKVVGRGGQPEKFVGSHQENKEKIEVKKEALKPAAKSEEKKEKFAEKPQEKQELSKPDVKQPEKKFTKKEVKLFKKISAEKSAESKTKGSAKK